MNLKLYKMDEYIEKKPKLTFTNFIKEKIEKMSENLYIEMKSFYKQKNKKMPSEHYIYLLYDNDIVIGFRHFLVNIESKSAELFAIAVDPQFQKQGYAKKMITLSIDFLISLNIKKIKVPLIKSYELGIVTLEKYYSNVIKKKYDNIEWNIEISNA